MQFSVPYPEGHVFKRKRNETKNSTLPAGCRIVYELDRVEYPIKGGILVYKKGLLYPTKGMVYPEAIYAINLAKGVLMEGFRLIKTWIGKIIAIFFLFQPFKFKIRTTEHLLKAYISSIYSQVENHILEIDKMTPVAQSVYYFTKTFVERIGCTEEILLLHFPLIVATTIEYDNVYRFRLEDLCSETSRNLLKNPRRELQRMIEIYKDREETDEVRNELVMIMQVFKLALLHSRVKKAFQESLDSFDFENLQYDEIDEYNVLELGGYKYMGKSWEERYQKFKNLHGGTPPQHFVID